jgi:hypothetical protein
MRTYPSTEVPRALVPVSNKTQFAGLPEDVRHPGAGLLSQGGTHGGKTGNGSLGRNGIAPNPHLGGGYERPHGCRDWHSGAEHKGALRNFRWREEPCLRAFGEINEATMEAAKVVEPVKVAPKEEPP